MKVFEYQFWPGSARPYLASVSYKIESNFARLLTLGKLSRQKKRVQRFLSTVLSLFKHAKYTRKNNKNTMNLWSDSYLCRYVRLEAAHGAGARDEVLIGLIMKCNVPRVTNRYVDTEIQVDTNVCTNNEC